MDLELRGKSVLVTGASKDTGLECAEAIAAEVAALATFLASARAAYISATVVTIDAGQSLRQRTY